jgi:hypothetical protein
VGGKRRGIEREGNRRCGGGGGGGETEENLVG